MQLESSRFCSS